MYVCVFLSMCVCVCVSVSSLSTLALAGGDLTIIVHRVTQ